MSLNHDRHRHRGRPTEEADPKGPDLSGPQTHIKRAPVRKLSPAEIAAFVKGRPDLPGGGR